MQTHSKSKTDLQLQHDVLTELSWDTRVESTAIGVEVKSGIVTLTGTADCWAKKHAAEQAAHRVAGVHDVANDIEVRPSWAPGMTDAEIAAAVRHALVADQLVPDDKIKTTVEEGLVTLDGVVDYAAQREDAARAIQHLAGIRGVFNHITVEPPSLIEPAAVRAAITAAMERHACRACDKVELDIEGGHVTLKGTVQTSAERRAIVGAALGTRGVQVVVDQIQLAQ